MADLTAVHLLHPALRVPGIAQRRRAIPAAAPAA